MRTLLRWTNQSPAATRYVLICMVISLGYFILQKLHHRDGVADFRVYYDAANAFLSGEPVYGKAFGVSSGFYKYSPAALIPFIPLSWLPYPVASGIYYFIILSVFIFFSLALLRYLEQEFGFSEKNRGWALVLITLFLADHFERELHLGNVNVLLLVLAFILLRLMEQRKVLAAGLIYAVILLYKPHFLLLLPWFLLRREWKLIAYMIGGVAIGAALPMLIKGWGGNMTLLHQWTDAIRDHNVQLEHSPNTVYGIYHRFLLHPFGLEGNWITIVMLLGIVALLILWFMLRNNRNNPGPKTRFAEYFVLIALIPNLTHTDTEHFMWTWPLIAYAIARLLSREVPHAWIYTTTLILAFVPYCINSPDIVGRDLMKLFDEGGLLGIANLMIIAVAVILFMKQHSSKAIA